jgi:hypothetical protein
MKTLAICAVLVLATPSLAAAQAQGAAPAADASARPLVVTDATPIEAIAATPAGKAAIEKNIPELMPHPAYDQFKGMSLRQLEPLSGGIITDQKIAAVEAALKAGK